MVAPVADLASHTVETDFVGFGGRSKSHGCDSDYGFGYGCCEHAAVDCAQRYSLGVAGSFVGFGELEGKASCFDYGHFGDCGSYVLNYGLGCCFCCSALGYLVVLDGLNCSFGSCLLCLSLPCLS